MSTSSLRYADHRSAKLTRQRDAVPSKSPQRSPRCRDRAVSDHFRAILGCLLNEDWTTPRLVEMTITPDGHLLGRCEGKSPHVAFLGATDDLLRNIHGIAPLTELDGDEVGYLIGKIARLKRRL